MHRLRELLTHVLSYLSRPLRVGSDRGDVPGWVMVVVMTGAAAHQNHPTGANGSRRAQVWLVGA